MLCSIAFLCWSFTFYFRNLFFVLQLRVLKSLAIVQERFGQTSDLEATRESLSKLKEEHHLVSDNDSFSEEEQQPLAESSDDSDEDIAALGESATTGKENLKTAEEC